MGGSLLALAAVLSAGPVEGAVPPTFAQVRQTFVPSEAMLFDRHGELLHEIRVDETVRRLPWVELRDVSPALVQAVIQAEDKRFFEHGGVDWRALGDAAFDTFFRGSPRGASTLSMQVAAMLEPSLRAEGSRRTVVQKVEQIRAARELEGAWTKRQILEAYLNLSTFRGELSGVGAAVQGLFHKSPSGVTAPEAALLAALLRGPNARSDVVSRRACAVAGARDCRPLDRLAGSVLKLPPRLEPRAALAPHVARALLSRETRNVTTTLDAGVQAKVLDVLRRQLSTLSDRHVQDGAVLVLDNATGEVLAYAGNQGPGSSAPFVDGVRAPRQAGSTLKPFLYGMALEEQILTAASLLDDSPANLVTPSGLYVPQNYDRDFRGPVSVRTALSASLNVPAVRTLMLLGADRFVDRLRALGFAGVVESGDYYGYSLALGSADVTLWQLTAAYRSLAQGGRSSPPLLTAGPSGPSVPVANPAATWIVADILADRGARSTTFGLDNPLNTRVWSAVKTGTSKDMRDNWCIGFSRRYTVGVWVGNFDGSPMRDVSGVSGAAPIWLEVQQALNRGESSSTGHARPPEVVLQHVRFVPPVEPDRDEYFVKGTEIAEIGLKPPVAAAVRISYPGNGAILALDPDIPEGIQRVRFLPTAAVPGLHWRVGGLELPAEEDGGATWIPQAGRFDLTLDSRDGQVLDQVRFEVRGAVSRDK
ncbi:MAG: penicillin-binding protein 1C [Betaproteobacteria bacterium]|nr:penicillin-binding protein 1C [Betaproteobacteria bacterium]